MLIEKYFSAKTTLYSVSEQINTTTANGRFVLNMMGSIAQWERETIAERTKDALQAKLKRGECASAFTSLKLSLKRIFSTLCDGFSLPLSDGTHHV